MDSPKKTARIAGALYLLIIVGGLFTEAFVRSSLIVSGDATATANNIVASESLFRTGLVADLIVFLCDVGVAILFYVVLRPVSKTLALVAASLRLVMAAIAGFNVLNLLAPLLLLSGADYLSVFQTDQLHALVLLFLKIHTYGYHIALTFFGLHCMVLGYLLYKSDFFPRILGVLLIIASFGYLLNSFSAFMPNTISISYLILLLPALIAEVSLCGWLLVKGVQQQPIKS